MQDYEKLGAFYLGREYDLDGRTRLDRPLLYDSRDLTTHAVCIGMTGSGKTGLCIALLEEAAIDGIPAIAIDPKGDLGNLLLAFPDLRPEDFRPWIDEAEAGRAGEEPDAFAAKIAARWRKGLAEWDQDPARIARLRDAADIALYTPGSNAGLSLSVLRSLQAPAADAADDPEERRDRVAATVSALLGLLGIDADPLRSREHVLVARLVERAWAEGRDIDLGGLVREIQSPPIDRVGALDIESFFPARERAALALALNNLLASPGFSAWLEGEPLDVGRLLWTPEGRPRIAILSIAHLGDAERMFFVSLLLNEVLAWVRRQEGTSSLRAILYMDEVAGYLPPVASPPSKAPMLTLLKQARAYGLGVVLATQNPVDLDYKGLANAGTWLLGRLQTERDKARVLEGLEGASLGAGRAFDRASLDRALSGLGSRIFLMNDVHEDGPVVFESRWALSYLRGPLTRAQIQRLTAGRKPAAAGAAAPPAATGADGGTRPLLPHDVREAFLAPTSTRPPGASLVYRPAALGTARLHWVDAKLSVDHWGECALLAPLGPGDEGPRWDAAAVLSARPDLDAEPLPDAGFASPPPAALRAKSWSAWQKSLVDSLYRTQALALWRSAGTGDASRPGESEGDFRVRLRQRAREVRDGEVERLRQRYAARIRQFEERARRADERVEREAAAKSRLRLDTMISLGSTVLGAILGRKAASSTTIGRMATTARTYTRESRQQESVAAAERASSEARESLADLQAELEREVAGIHANDPAGALEPAAVRPRKSDIAAETPLLVWVPSWRTADGAERQAAD